MKKLFALLTVCAVFVACNDKDDDTPIFKYLTFEQVEETALAGPTSKGENLYSAYEIGEPGYDENSLPYTGYYDKETDLQWGLNIDNGDWNPSGEPEIYAGGIAVSRWNNKKKEGYDNQCSVYYGNKSGDRKGGKDGSPTFAVAYCPVSATEPVSIGFKDAEAEHVIESIWVNNSTYAVMSMTMGDGYANPLNKENNGWLKLKITGKNKDGLKTGSVEFYLADFREANSPGIVYEWSEIDLSVLRKVHKLEFSLTGSDNDPDYGLRTPAYFCMDNIKVRL